MSQPVKAILAALSIWIYVAPAQAQLYAIDDEKHTIKEYNADTGALMNASLVSGLVAPCAITYAGGNLFITDLFYGRVGKYDATTGATINDSLVTGVTSAQGLAVSGNDLYVCSLVGDGTGLVGKYDATTGAAINDSLVSKLVSPVGVGVSGNKLFVVNGTGGLGAVGEFDTTSGAAIEQTFVKYAPNPSCLFLSGRYLWLLIRDGIDKFNLDAGPSMGVTHRPYIMDLNTPNALTVSGDNLFVTDRANKTIGKYKASTGEVINASFISGLKCSYDGLTAVPGPPTGPP